jgi:hypothetical protein
VICRSKNVYRVTTQLDTFYATRLGLASQEHAPNKDVSKAYGIFSRVLIDALEGRAPDAMEVVANKKAITSQKLADYVENEVPEASGAIPDADVQYSEGIPGSRDPYRVYKWLIDAPAPPAPAPAPPPPPPPASHSPAPSAPKSRGGILGGLFGRGGRGAKSSGSAPGGSGSAGPRPRSTRAEAERDRQLRRNAIEALEKEILDKSGRPSFETRFGLSVTGARVVEAVVTGGQGDLFTEHDMQHMRGHGNNPLSAVLRLGDGRHIATTIFPHFITTIVVGAEGITSTSHAVAMTSPYYSADPPDEVRHAVATAVAHFRHGRFSVSSTEAAELAGKLRKYKAKNPSLGILAAYAYNRIGDREAIIDIAKYFRDEPPHMVPFDVGILTDYPIHQESGAKWMVKTDKEAFPISGSFPLLTQGWALLEAEQVPPVLRYATGGLLPSVWAMLRPKEGEALSAAVLKGEL